jgi:hypothetical protein
MGASRIAGVKRVTMTPKFINRGFEHPERCLYMQGGESWTDAGTLEWDGA